MTLQQERQDWIDDAPYIHHITELPSYQNMNYALARQDRVYTEIEDDVNTDDEFFPVLEEREEPAILSEKDNTSIAYEWSNKEGWSIDYFYKKVLPKINEAW